MLTAMVSSFIQQENMEALVQLKLSPDADAVTDISSPSSSLDDKNFWRSYKVSEHKPWYLLNLLLQTISYITLFQLHFGYFIVTFSVLELIWSFLDSYRL